MAPNAGWFDYVPLANKQFDPGRNIDFYCLGIIFNSISSTLTAGQFIVTILKSRAPGMSFNRMPLFCFAFLAASFGLLFALPALTADTIFLFLDRNVGTHFFDPSHGGSALLWQHLFWIFGHPEVYILIVPAFGIATVDHPGVHAAQGRRLPARRDRRAARRLHRLRRLGAPHVRDRDADDHDGLLRRRDRDGGDPVARSRSSPGA